MAQYKKEKKRKKGCMGFISSHHRLVQEGWCTFHDNLHDEALWSKIAVIIVERKVPDKHVNDVRFIGAGYILTVAVCNSHQFCSFLSGQDWPKSLDPIPKLIHRYNYLILFCTNLFYSISLIHSTKIYVLTSIYGFIAILKVF
jgi:hypothetical protein